MMPVEISGLYKIDLPTNLKPGYDIHDFASLQYYDVDEQMYVIGIEDAKKNFGKITLKRIDVEDYFKFVEKVVFQPADSLADLGRQNFVTDDVHAELGDFYARMPLRGKTYELFYRVAVYESRSHFFQLIVWTPFDKREEAMGWIDAITASFELIKQRV